MSTEYLIDIAFNNICLYKLVKNAIKHIPEDKEKQEEYMDNEFSKYLIEYQGNLEIGNKVEKLKVIKKYIKNINIDNIQEKNIIDYLFEVIYPFMEEKCKEYPVISPDLTPSLIYNFTNTFKKYISMSDINIKNCQNVISNSILEDKMKEQKFKQKENELQSKIKSFKKKNNELEENNIKISEELRQIKTKYEENNIQFKDNLIKKDNEIKILNNSVKELKIELDEFKTKVEKEKLIKENEFKEFKTKVEKDIKTINYNFEIKEQKLRNANKEIEDLKYNYKNFDNFKTKIISENIDYENSIKQYSQENLEINIYNRKLEFLKDSFKSNNIKLEEENDELKDRIKNLKEKNKNLDDEIKDLKVSKEILMEDNLKFINLNKNLSYKMSIEKINYRRDRKRAEYIVILNNKRINELENEINSMKIKIKELENEKESMKMRIEGLEMNKQ